MEPLDVLEQVLSTMGPSGIRRPLHEEAARTLPGLVELGAVRWSWWADTREHLERSLPGTGIDWRRFPAPERGLIVPFVSDSGAVHEVPAPGTGWSAGEPFALFQERFKTALVRAGAPSRLAFMVVGAFNEMASNSVEHSRSPVPPVASFQVSGGQWCFSVTDVGCGLRESLGRNPKLTAVADEASAIRLAVQDGVSSTGQPSRGFGFTHVFRALVDRSAVIRFRTTGALGTWSGTSPAAHMLGVTISPRRAGFHAQVAGDLPQT